MSTQTRVGTNSRMNPGINGAGWDRRRLLCILAAAVAVAVLLLVGLIFAVAHVVGSLGGDDSQPADIATGEQVSSGTAVGVEHRDEIAAAPMLEVPAEAMEPIEGSQHVDAPQIRIPSGTDLGPVSVLTGFPHTPEGAVGQLAQVETTVLQSMSLAAASDAYQAWALPGGVSAENWALTQSVQTFLDSAEMGEAKDPAATVTAQPVGALVKGTDGPDWVTACVLMKVSAVYREEGQVAFGHCERMQWVGGRWMVASGLPPAPAPSTWPGTQLARDAGWRTWVSEAPVDDGTDTGGHTHNDTQGDQS